MSSIAIFVSTDNGPFSLLTTVTPVNPTALFTGQPGNLYGFFSVATDNAGNVQPTPVAAQTTIEIVPALSVVAITPVAPIRATRRSHR